MGDVQVFTDSLSDLPQSWIKQYNIGIVPVYVVFSNDKFFRDQIEISTDQIYRNVLAKGKIPCIAAPTPEDFISSFRPAVSAGKNVLFISMSSELSPTYNNAVTAAAHFPAGRVQIVDSFSVSAGAALTVMSAVRAARKGLQIMDIVTLLQRFREDVEFNVLLDSSSSLNIAKDVFRRQKKAKSLLNLRQQVTVKMGRFQREVKYNGKQTNSLEMIMQNVVDNKNHMDLDLLIISQTMAEQPAEYLREKLNEMTSIKNIIITPSISGLLCRTKPSSLAVSYLIKPSHAYIQRNRNTQHKLEKSFDAIFA